MIVVLDSNVWISALHFYGTPLAALNKACTADLIACCYEIRIEVRRTLMATLHWQPENAATAMDQYLDKALDIPITGAVSGICRDPKDDMILECAVKAMAEVIVTGDKDLLTLGSHEGIRIFPARIYLAL